MEISHNTKFDIGDIIYFLEGHTIMVGVIYLAEVKKHIMLRSTKIDSEVEVRYMIMSKDFGDGFFQRTEEKLFASLDEIKEHILDLYPCCCGAENPSVANLASKDWFLEKLEEYRNKQSEQ